MPSNAPITCAEGARCMALLGRANGRPCTK
jgi:hypothetical protein